MFSGSAIIADAKLSFPPQTAINTTEAALFPVPVFDPPVFSSFRAPFTPVAIFTDANPTAPITDFTATRVDRFVHYPKVVVGSHPRGPLQK